MVGERAALRLIELGLGRKTGRQGVIYRRRRGRLSSWKGGGRGGELEEAEVVEP